MSFTARPPFASGMQNSSQNQQQQGQSNTSNAAPGAVPNLSMINNPTTKNVQPNNYPASSSSVMFEHQKLMEQQLLVQTQLMLQQQQQQPKQQTAQTQQANFQHQTNPQQAALSRLVSEIQKNGGSSLAQQQQQLQQFVQMTMLQQVAQQGLLHQQKSFQQQAVPLPSNTTITPVGRQNVQLTQKQSTNYPRSNAVKPQSMSPAQSRNKNAPMMTAKPAIPTIPPGISPSLNISTVAPKGYSDNYAARQAAAANITPSLTITKTSSPSSSSQMAKSASGLVNRPIGSNAATANIPSLQKSLIPEAISMSLANVLSAKTKQAPSVSLTPAIKLNALPTVKSTPMTPQKINVPPAVANIQKLSPTSPRLKQTPRKNMNPIKTSLSPGALPTSVQSAVPRTDMKTETKTVSSTALTNVPILAGSAALGAKPMTTNNATVAKPLSTASPSTKTTQESVKPVASSPAKIESVKKESIAVKSEPKNEKTLNLPLKKKNEMSPNGSIPSMVQNSPKMNTAEETPVKAPVTVESEKKSADNDKNKTIKPVFDSAEIKPLKQETIQKQTSKVVEQPTEMKSKEVKEVVKSAPNNKAPSTPVNTKAPVAKANVASTSKPGPSSIEVRAKRNRLKTIPYQSPTPEIELVSKISAIEASNLNRNTEEKLTLFYKNEFLAVRNADGGFFLCQTINNVYKTSPKIRIRWLSEEPTNQNMYGLDFYDSTDLECVLTSVSLAKKSKGKFELTKAERERIENILKRALDVEKGVVIRPEVTEENPDGLDFSLYTDESQIEKKSPAKRKSNNKTQSVQQSAASSASKRKSTNKASDETPQKKAKQSAKKSISSKTPDTKTSLAGSVKKTSVSMGAKAKTMTVESTPTSKRTATKRKLIDDENTDVVDTKNDQELSKDNDTKANKEIESPKEVAERATSAGESPNNQSDRSVRRSRN